MNVVMRVTDEEASVGGHLQLSKRALHWLGVPFASALLGVFTYRIFNFWLALVPALAVLPTVRMIRREIRQTDAELERV